MGFHRNRNHGRQNMEFFKLATLFSTVIATIFSSLLVQAKPEPKIKSLKSQLESREFLKAHKEAEKLMETAEFKKHGYYLIPQNILKLMPPKVRPETLRSEGQFRLVELSPQNAFKLSHVVHEKMHACGGFFDVTSEVHNASSLSEFQFSAYSDNRQLVLPFKHAGLQFVGKAKTGISFLNRSRYSSTLKTLTEFPDRSARTENGRKAALWLQDHALSYAKAAGRSDITSRTIVSGRRYTQDSIVIKIKGSTNGPGVLIGGHMDTFRRSKPGADDDGSGTISVMEIFKAIIDSKMTFKNDLYFAFYAAEELGLVGSGRMAKTFKSEKIELRGVMQFDMMGFKSDKDDKAFHFIEDYTSPELTRFAKDLAVNVLDIPTQRIGATKCRYACSDHASWNRQGYAAVFPFESKFNSHNRRIHTSRDTFDSIDIDHAMNFVRLGMAFMVELGQPI